MKCVGYGPNGERAECPNDAGTPWTDYWCLPCDERRRARISRRFASIESDLRKKSAAAGGTEPEAGTNE